MYIFKGPITLQYFQCKPYETFQHGCELFKSQQRLMEREAHFKMLTPRLSWLVWIQSKGKNLKCTKFVFQLFPFFFFLKRWPCQISPGVSLISTSIHPALFSCLRMSLHTRSMFHLSQALGVPCLDYCSSWKQPIQCTCTFFSCQCMNTSQARNNQLLTRHLKLKIFTSFTFLALMGPLLMAFPHFTCRSLVYTCNTVYERRLHRRQENKFLGGEDTFI